MRFYSGRAGEAHRGSVRRHNHARGPSRTTAPWSPTGASPVTPAPTPGPSPRPFAGGRPGTLARRRRTVSAPLRAGVLTSWRCSWCYVTSVVDGGLEAARSPQRRCERCRSWRSLRRRCRCRVLARDHAAVAHELLRTREARERSDLGDAGRCCRRRPTQRLRCAFTARISGACSIAWSIDSSRRAILSAVLAPRAHSRGTRPTRSASSSNAVHPQRALHLVRSFPPRRDPDAASGSVPAGDGDEDRSPRVREHRVHLGPAARHPGGRRRARGQRSDLRPLRRRRELRHRSGGDRPARHDRSRSHRHGRRRGGRGGHRPAALRAPSRLPGEPPAARHPGRRRCARGQRPDLRPPRRRGRLGIVPVAAARVQRRSAEALQRIGAWPCRSPTLRGRSR